MNRLRLPFVLVLALVIQTTLVGPVTVAGAHPDLMLLLPIAAGFSVGSEQGAVAGFLAGLLTDLFLQTPLGLSALTFSVVGFGVGMVQTTMIRAAWWITPATAFIASGIGVLLFGVVAATVGQGQLLRPALLTAAAVVGVANALFSIPAVRVMRWALASGSLDRAYAR